MVDVDAALRGKTIEERLHMKCTLARYRVIADVVRSR
jgi:hypothetical protein